MSEYSKPCQGMNSALSSASKNFRWPILFKTTARLKYEGMAKTLIWTLCRTLNRLGFKHNKRFVGSRLEGQRDTVLNLQSGQLIEVKSMDEILTTLDMDGRTRGLAFMPEMTKFCGQRFKVYKRLKTMILEATGEVKHLKNTVLLEDVICDGSHRYGCDRSCFHYWREAWLKKVDE